MGLGLLRTKKVNIQKYPQTGNVIIEDNVDVGAATSIDRATLGSTIIRKGVKLDNHIQIAHNVEIGKNTVIAAQTGIAGSTKIGENCMIGWSGWNCWAHKHRQQCQNSSTKWYWSKC